MYIVNILEYDLINSFHMHGNFFDWYPTGTSKTASELTDTVMLCQGQRGIPEVRFPTAGKFMFHAHQSEFTELGWQGFFEVRVTATDTPRRRAPAWVLGLVPLLLIVRRGRAVRGARRARARRPARAAREELAVERTVLKPGVIELTVRNDGPDAVRVPRSSSTTRSRSSAARTTPIGRLETARVRVQQPWIEGEAYEVALLTSSGGTIVHEIPVAVATPETACPSSG